MKRIISLSVIIIIVVSCVLLASGKTNESQLPVAYNGNSLRDIQDLENGIESAVETAYSASEQDSGFASELGYVIVTDYI